MMICSVPTMKATEIFVPHTDCCTNMLHNNSLHKYKRYTLISYTNISVTCRLLYRV